MMLLIAVTMVVALLAVYYFSSFLSGVGVASRRRSRSVLLVGLTGSGKTTLFAQLVARRRVAVRTSMEPNRGVMSAACQEGLSARTVSSGIEVIDFPGHRRLREGLIHVLAEVKKVVFVVDSVTVQDPHNGAGDVAELMVAVLSSPAFYGVKGVLVACTKRDELTSYSAKAVQKLLEKEITHCLTTHRGDVQRIGNIVNASGVAVGLRKRQGEGSSANGCRSYELSLDEVGKFSFSNFPVSVQFADVSSFVGDAGNTYNVEPIRAFAAD